MSYDGGKGGAGVYQWIINQMPPHRVYIEAFVGGGSVLRAKLPACSTIAIDVDASCVSMYVGDEVPGLLVKQADALEFLASYSWVGDEFVYLDPPYLLSTRSYQLPLYACEFATIEQHRALLALVRSLPCMVAISGYWSELYELELFDWRVSTFNTVKRSGAVALEYLWMNYPEPLELHDYRYLGRGFRERERIKRKKQRWVSRLRSMPSQERYALMAVIAELHQPGSIVVDGDTRG